MPPVEGVEYGDFVVRPGNVLRIGVWPDPDGSVSGDFTVEETGLVYLPVVGVVRAAGLSMDSLRSAVREGYAETFQEPVVTVTVLFRVGIHDAVQSPGLYWAEPTWSLLDLIGEAGGFRPDAKEDELRLIRDGHVLDFDAERYLETGEASIAVPLHSGDRIVVPHSRNLFTAANLSLMLATTNLVLQIINLTR